MENPQRKKNQPQRHRPIRIIGGGGGDIGAVIAWGGAVAIAGLVAVFAIKRRFFRTKDTAGATKKTEQVQKTEEMNGGRNVKQTQTKTKIDSCDLVSALLGEKKDIPAPDIAPLINYGIPAPLDVVDLFNTINPDIEEIIPFNKLKPEFIAGIVEECKSLVIDKVDPPVPLKEGKAPVERLILKPIISQLTLEAEPLLSPIKEVEERDDDDDDEGDEESIGAVASEETGESSSMFNDEAIWPAEMIEELTRELKEMKIDLERPREGDMAARNKDEECEEKDSSNAMNEEKEVVSVAVEQTAKLSRSRSSSWIWLSMLVMILLVLLLFRLGAMALLPHQ